MKKILACMLAVVLLVSLAGCGKSGKKPVQSIEEVTLVCYSGYLPSMKAYVFTPDCTVTQYDFTEYYLENPYDYFTDPLPPASKYTSSTYTGYSEDWAAIQYVIEAEGFFLLPEEMREVNGFDFPSYYVQVKAGDTVHTCGGYGAGFTDDVASRHFSQIMHQLTDVLTKVGAAK